MQSPEENAPSSTRESASASAHITPPSVLMANSLDGPASSTISCKQEPAESAARLVSAQAPVHLPTVLDMAAVTWQTRRAPKASRHENRSTSGTCVQYFNQTFVERTFSGVLKVSVLSVESFGKPLSEVRSRVLTCPAPAI